MDEFSFERLEWDSGFFGMEIRKIQLDRILTEDEAGNMVNAFKDDLLYVFSPCEQSSFNGRLWLADEKVIYSRQSLTPQKPSHRLVSVNKFSEALLHLALLSGEYSRFRLDPVLSPQFEKLYSEWLRRSVNRSIADEALAVEDDDGNAQGFITLKSQHDSAVVGLIAVHASQQGRGIGRSLMEAAENWALAQGLDRVKVATQKRNDGACRFYSKSGYQVESIQYIYHYHNVRNPNTI